MAEIGFLREQLIGLTGVLFLEFNIPRMGRRIDTVLVVGPVVFVIEFKVGESNFDRAATDQVWGYALRLEEFSRRRPIRVDSSVRDVGTLLTSWTK